MKLISTHIKKAILLCLIPAVFLGGSSAAFGGNSSRIQASAALPEQSANHRIIDETPEKILWVLPDKKNVWISKKPKRVVVLLTSLLHLWYETDGQAIARCSSKLHVPNGTSRGQNL